MLMPAYCRTLWLSLLRVYLELFRAIPVLVWLYLLFFGLDYHVAVILLRAWLRAAGDVPCSAPRRSTTE